MVQKITLFEVHLDDARFGTNDSVDAETAATESDDGPSVAKLALASLFLSVAVTVIVRRLFADDETTDESEEPFEIDTDDAPVDVEIES